MERIAFNPVANDFAGWPMPASLPPGLHLELCRAPLLDGAEARLDEWMQMLHDRYDECLLTLPQEHMAFEASFVHQEGDGSWWFYHLSVYAEGSPGLQLNNDLDRTHAHYSRTTLHHGWEELQPRLFLAPNSVREAMIAATQEVSVLPKEE